MQEDALSGARRALAAAATGGDERSALSTAGGELDAYLRDFAPRAIRAARAEPSPAEEVALDNESTARLRTLDADLGRIDSQPLPAAVVSLEMTAA